MLIYTLPGYVLFCTYYAGFYTCVRLCTILYSIMYKIVHKCVHRYMQNCTSLRRKPYITFPCVPPRLQHCSYVQKKYIIQECALLAVHCAGGRSAARRRRARERRGGPGAAAGGCLARNPRDGHPRGRVCGVRQAGCRSRVPPDSGAGTGIPNKRSTNFYSQLRKTKQNKTLERTMIHRCHGSKMPYGSMKPW